MNNQEPRTTLAKLLRQSQAHAGLARALENFPYGLAGQKADGFNHTAWEQVEHLRLAAEDLVGYCIDPDYEELGWPEGYWPETSEPSSEEAWQESTRKLLEATEAMAALVENAEHDLYAKAPSAEKDYHHTLRSALILLDHNGYHAGQLIQLRIALGIWPPT